MGSSLVPRPSHRPVFDRLQCAKTEGEGLGAFYHVNDVSVYLGRQRRGGVIDRKDAFHGCVLRL